jgi:hypothetical protein
MTHRIIRDRRIGSTVVAATAAAAVAAAIFVGTASRVGAAGPGEGRGPDTYRIGLFGDMPYNALGRSQYPNLLTDINASNVAFSIFDGDLKAGGDGPCSNSLYSTAIAQFNTLERPLVWLPGDNDWTDCWGRYGPSQQPFFDPIERLAYERQVFDSTDQSLGEKTLTLTRESSEGGPYALYSENVRWSYGPVVYIGLDVQGSNDNYPWVGFDPRSDAEIARQQAEEIARKAANLHWLSEGFTYAKQVGAKGILIDWQADPNFNNENDPQGLHPHDWDAFPDYVNALRTETEGFSGQVALVHGDSHYFKIDKPLNNASGGVLRNFTRVETFGARNTHWVSATIDPTDPNLFVFEPRLVPGND